MNEFAGYSLVEKISDSGKSLVYRARKGGEHTVILKILKTQKPTPADIARFQHEYDLLKSLSIEGIVRTYDILRHDDFIGIVLEDFNGESLKGLIGTPFLSLEMFLVLSVQIAHTLGLLHRQNIMHRDIKPHNILVNTEQAEARITDFGISSVVTGWSDELYSRRYIEGTLLYMSPEQTGRMNRYVDYRSDLYSLGVTFYEILTGEPPFSAGDPLELIHAHMARLPVPPEQRNHAVPAVLSDIVMKLMAKTAEYRYQSSFGLEADLRRCLDGLRESGEIQPFEIAQNDISDRFNIPQKLYGRSEEMRILLDAFDHAAAGPSQFLTVCGSPGIGKTALVSELQKPVVAARGYYLFGKYDRFKRDVPFSGFIQALQSLVKQLLTESEERIALWRERIIEALGHNGSIVVDAIPEVGLILGPQPEVPAMGPEESQNRFLRVFKKFFMVFAQREHPLVVFLDDLQWADTASFNVLREMLMDHDIRYLFIVGSYRDGEVDAAHPLTQVLDDVARAGRPAAAIVVKPIGLEDITVLLVESLKAEREPSRVLAELVFEKTRGNPFFIIQFVKSLYDSRMLRYEPGGGWHWDMDRIRELQVTDNVVELMAAKIAGLSGVAQGALRIAACIGNRFQLETISIVNGKPVEQVLVDLSEALDEGFIHYLNDMYRFLHDRIQEAVYSLISAEERTLIHSRIGRHVLQGTSERDLREKVFYIVNQLNLGIAHVRPEDRGELLRLNLMAGRKARLSTAYESAVRYFETALSLIPGDRWEADYGASMEIGLELAACRHLGHDYERAGVIFTELMDHAQTPLDRAGILNLRMLMEATMGRHVTAVDTGLAALRLLGHPLPRTPGQLTVLLNLLRVKVRLGGRGIDSLASLPAVDKPAVELAMMIMTNILWSAYFFNPELMMVLSMRMLLLTLQRGLSRYSSVGFSVYGVLLVVIGDFRNADRFAELAMTANERFMNREVQAKITMLLSGVKIWVEHARSALVILRRALDIAFENGDLNYAIYIIQGLVLYRVFYGERLDDIEKVCGTYHEFIERSRDPGALNYLVSVRQYARALQGRTDAPASLDEAGFSEAQHLQRMESDNIPIILQRHYVLKMRLLYIMKDYEGALAAARESERLLKYSMGIIVVADHQFFYALILAARCETAAGAPSRESRRKIQKLRRALAKLAQVCPENFNHRLLLVDAELARMRGDSAAAMEAYTKAAAEAGAAGFVHCAALASERGAAYLASRGMDKLSHALLSDARYQYLQWGAAAKVAALDVEFPYLSMGEGRGGGPGGMELTVVATTGSSSTGASDRLELDSVMKASLAISGEIHLDRLMEKMMAILMENAGAQRGFLILDRNGELVVESAADIADGADVTVARGPLSGGAELSRAAVHFVERTRESLIIADAADDPTIGGDEYVRRRKPRSVLCAPIMNQGKLTGVIYLENNLAAGAFTPERVEILQMLSAQIAISIENARLYENLEGMVRDRTEKLKLTLDEVQALKTQQDGDYFLTSLLLEPLAGNYAAIDGVTISFLNKEKKEFTFRKWHREIGGDISISYNVHIRGRDCAVFVNADAMGKSIQGAGGALVMGAVFKAIVERTNQQPLLQEASHDDWIARACAELQAVFESFDCSMMVSLVMGVVDPVEGIMHLVNAEHPFTVLYRAGGARFIDKGMTARKIGIPGFPPPRDAIRVRLDPGDVIIAGTDGRDEIILNGTTRVINEDETLFLRAVEEGRGELGAIHRAILSRGEIADDISLIRIAYREGTGHD